jgi:hypothetical protein
MRWDVYVGGFVNGVESHRVRVMHDETLKSIPLIQIYQNTRVCKLGPKRGN